MCQFNRDSSHEQEEPSNDRKQTSSFCQVGRKIFGFSANP